MKEQSTDTALVVQRLSLVPQGAEHSALAIVDEFALAAPEFTEGSEKLIDAANAFEVTDQTSCQIADEIQDEHKREITSWDNRRLTVTRPLDDLKSYITGLIKSGIDNRRTAIGIYQGKVTAYRKKKREEEMAAQREAERLLAEERRRLEEEARKKEEKATQLKTEAARQRAADDAARLREQAEMVPTSVAVATSGPTLAASNVADIWEGGIPLCDVCKAVDAKRPDPKRECSHNRKIAVQTILAKWDEWGSVIEFRTGSSRDGKKGMNDMAAHYKDTLTLPGFVFESRESFRSKARKIVEN